MFLPQTNTGPACKPQTEQLLKIILKNPPSPTQPLASQREPEERGSHALPSCSPCLGQGQLEGPPWGPGGLLLPLPLGHRSLPWAAGFAEHNGAETAQSCRAKYIPVAGGINNKQQRDGDGRESLVLLGLRAPGTTQGNKN